jgi:glycosyltransferase involved in cell wall biosynthesis
MVTLIYNIQRPEQGGVGRYTFEILRKLRNRIKFNEIDLLPSFGKNNFEKLLAILWKRRKFLLNQLDKFSEINHFLQTEIFYYFKAHGKMIVNFHNPPPFTESFSDMYPGYYQLARSFLFLNRYREALNKADFLIANSQLTKEGILEKGVDRSKVKVIDLGIDERFKIIKPFEKRKNIVGYVGSFATHKRIDKLLNDWERSFDRLRNFHLNLWGSKGTQENFLKNRYNGKFSISFLGRFPEKVSVKIYNSFKAFVFPTKGESFGLPAIEAVACGTPAFIYKDSKITREVKKCCIEIESVSEIPKILEGIKEKEIIKKSREVKKEFNWNKNAEETLKVYKKLE